MTALIIHSVNCQHAFTLHSKKAINCKRNLQLECARVEKKIKNTRYPSDDLSFARKESIKGSEWINGYCARLLIDERWAQT